MSARLMANPEFRAAARPRLRDDEMPTPPRAMTASAEKGKRRRAWPRWTRSAVKSALMLVPVLGLAATAGSAWKHGNLADNLQAAEDGLIRATGSLGFRLQEILVVGRSETERDAVLDALGVRRGEPILSIDLADAKQRLEELPWVSSASIERRLPGFLYIRLSERQPMAIWQHDRQFTVIDRAGRPLADAMELARRGNQRIDTLPQVVGANAPQQVHTLLSALDNAPTIAPMLSSASWISDRRWNLQLSNGVTVRLPEGTGEMRNALRQLEQMHTANRVLDRDIVAIDLRQPDRAAIQTSATAQLPGWDDDAKKKSGKKS
ncbi:cell division protein FtsQ/DivIB [Azospirillum picis]|uniref:Cell division protein FtsQ n=1 Tax=Azospirillum picis TaxID=488438 RepID=A0ABU0MIX3_9PROT|nr:cell division protein FtsQ/DivIB [Azospirillum picis]MBP2299495.1 cell division protein FtsQ [Azospirillum picis]MDQ0533378.1 cell division protein FtsQ [Azospirillum picis]